jgi:hypothetical protein
LLRASITGGLVVAGTACGFPRIALDHDRRNTLSLGYNAKLPRQFFIGSNLSVKFRTVQPLRGAADLPAEPPAELRSARPDRGP